MSSLSLYIYIVHRHTHTSIYSSFYLLSIYMTYTYTCILLVFNILQDCVPSDASRGTGGLSLSLYSTQTHICMYVSIYLYIYIYMYLYNTHIYIYIYLLLVLNALKDCVLSDESRCAGDLFLYIYILQKHTYVCMYLYMYICVCIYIYNTHIYICILLVLTTLKDCVLSDESRGTGELFLYTCSTQTHIYLSIYLSMYVSMYLSILHVHIYIFLVLNTLKDCVLSDESRGIGDLSLHRDNVHTFIHIYLSIHPSIYLNVTYYIHILG